MNKALRNWIMEYQFSHYYNSETEWKRAFDKFKDDLKKARAHLSNYDG